MVTAVEGEILPASLHEALRAFQADAPKITKDAKAKVGSFTYDYASIEHLYEAVLPRLSELGLVWVTRPALQEGRPVLVYELGFRPAGGEQESIGGIAPLMVSPSGSSQDLGGAITYMRRYSLCCVLGLAPEKDDDAAPRPAAKEKKATKAEATALAKRAEAAGVLERLQLAASHLVGEDVGPTKTVDEAMAALTTLTKGQLAQIAIRVEKAEHESA